MTGLKENRLGGRDSEPDCVYEEGDLGTIELTVHEGFAECGKHRMSQTQRDRETSYPL